MVEGRKKESTGQRWLSLTFQRRNFFLFFSPKGANAGEEETKKKRAVNGASSDARVVAGYQFNLFSMNGRIGFLKVPVSLGEPHFLTPL